MNKVKPIVLGKINKQVWLKILTFASFDHYQHFTTN